MPRVPNEKFVFPLLSIDMVEALSLSEYQSYLIQPDISGQHLIFLVLQPTQLS